MKVEISKKLVIINLITNELKWRLCLWNEFLKPLRMNWDYDGLNMFTLDWTRWQNVYMFYVMTWIKSY